MRTIDIIIVTNSEHEESRRLTQQTIDTAKDNVGFIIRPIIVETSGVLYPYKNTQGMLKLSPKDFGYNRALNLGAWESMADYIAFCNNDLIFEKGWANKLLKQMEENDLRSASGYCPRSRDGDGIKPNTGIHYGTQTRKYLTGWCYIWRADLWQEVKEKFKGHDEELKFWCCDNATTEQLNQLGERHGLITDVIIEHAHGGSSTLNRQDQATKNNLCIRQVKVFNKKYGKNIFNLGT